MAHGVIYYLGQKFWPNLPKDLTQDRSEWRNINHIADPKPLGQGYNDDD